MNTNDPEQQPYRYACRCDDCRYTRAALALLDTACTSEAWMGSQDIVVLCKAREILAYLVGSRYNEGTNRYE